MRRQAGFLVEKRDGRREWLRATKLARSLRAALLAAGVDDDWLAAELTSAAIAQARGRDGGAGCLRATALAEAAARVLIASGNAPAAMLYAAVGQDRRRRRLALVPDAPLRHGMRVVQPLPGGDPPRRT